MLLLNMIFYLPSQVQSISVFKIALLLVFRRMVLHMLVGLFSECVRVLLNILIFHSEPGGN